MRGVLRRAVSVVASVCALGAVAVTPAVADTTSAQIEAVRVTKADSKGSPLSYCDFDPTKSNVDISLPDTYVSLVNQSVDLLPATVRIQWSDGRCHSQNVQWGKGWTELNNASYPQWNRYLYGTVKDDNGSDLYVMGDSNKGTFTITAYVNANPDPESGAYTVTFYGLPNKAGVDNYIYTVNGKVQRYSVEAEKSLTESSMPSLPTAPKGYTYDHWEDADGKKFEAGKTTYKKDAKVSLYPHEIAKTYTVKYEAGYEGGVNPELKTNVKYEDAGLLPENVTRPGYTLKGWKVKDGTTTVTKTTKLSELLPNDDNTSVTLVAQWEVAQDGLTLTYDANGGQNGPGTETMTVGTAHTLATTNLPTHADTDKDVKVVFAGWTTTDTNEVVYSLANKPTAQPVTSVTPTTDTTVYALWSEDADNNGKPDINQDKPDNTKPEVKKYTVKFVSNGGTTVADQEIEEGKKATLVEPTRDNYTFKGWYSDKALTKAYDFDTPVTSNLTLYAKWKKNFSWGDIIGGGDNNGSTEVGWDRPVRRLYNETSKEHFYTSSQDEIDHLKKIGWKDEGIAFTMSTEGNPVYRFYNTNSGMHLFTTSKVEADSVKKAGWTDEGVPFREPTVDDAKDVYRLYNPNTQDHLLTTNWFEYTLLRVLPSWQGEGVAFRAK